MVQAEPHPDQHLGDQGDGTGLSHLQPVSLEVLAYMLQVLGSPAG